MSEKFVSETRCVDCGERGCLRDENYCRKCRYARGCAEVSMLEADLTLRGFERLYNAQDIGPDISEAEYLLRKFNRRLYGYGWFSGD